jgi:hypothetical protein
MDIEPFKAGEIISAGKLNTISALLQAWSKLTVSWGEYDSVALSDDGVSFNISRGSTNG